MSVQHDRKESMFFRAVSQIVSEEITNSNVSYPTVTGVKLTPDGSHLTVFLSFESNPQKSLDAIQNARGFVRSKLAHIPNIRKAPEVHFKIDESIERGKRIDEILKEINKKEQK